MLAQFSVILLLYVAAGFFAYGVWGLLQVHKMFLDENNYVKNHGRAAILGLGSLIGLSWLWNVVN